MAKGRKVTKVEEKEVEIDDVKKVKALSYVQRWFDDNAVDNKSDMKAVCDLVSKEAENQFSMHLKSGNTEVYAAVFYATFMSIIDFLKSKQKQYNCFSITICNSINIGYTNNSNDDNEKIGNFMPFLEYVGVNRPITTVPDSTNPDLTSESYIRWLELNVKQNIEFIKTIQMEAFARLDKDFHVNLRTDEAIIPLFCTFLDMLSNYIRYKFQEANKTDVSEISFNVLGLFDMYYSYDETEKKEIREIVPGITLKLMLKSDEIASR